MIIVGSDPGRVHSLRFRPWVVSLSFSSLLLLSPSFIHIIFLSLSFASCRCMCIHRHEDWRPTGFLTSGIRDYRSSNAVAVSSARYSLSWYDEGNVSNPLRVRLGYFLWCWFQLLRAIGSSWKYYEITNPGARFAFPEIRSGAQLLICLGENCDSNLSKLKKKKNSHRDAKCKGNIFFLLVYTRR